MNYQQLNFYLLIILIFFSFASYAGEINTISFDNDSIIHISHKECTLGDVMQERKKLIIPMQNCQADKGKIKSLNKNLKKIYWAQHDQNSVWIVLAFSKPYEFEIENHLDEIKICLPFCQTYIKKPLAIVNAQPIMFYRNGIPFMIPLENVSMEKFIDQSIGFTPKDMIRDGLPHFGSKRGDWQGKPREHRGYDIYVDKINVLAAAAGTVLTISKGSRSGLYIKLRHPHDIDTLYVHLAQSFVKEGQKVNQGTVIGRVEGPAGNAVSAQLHFEIKVKGDSLDPLEFIESYYKNNAVIMAKIKAYKNQLQELILQRDQKVQEFLSSHR